MLCFTGRLKVNYHIGDLDGDGDIDVLFSSGGRGITLWGCNGELISDTGDLFETLLANTAPEIFNAESNPMAVNLAEVFDTRSDDKVYYFAQINHYRV